MSDPAGEVPGSSLQERYAPEGVCFGCGPANPTGLHVRSYPSGSDSDELVATWDSQPDRDAFPGWLNGGIIGSLLDCHANWTAAHHLMKRRGAVKPPTTVTAGFEVRLLRPTPSDGPVALRAHIVESTDHRATVAAELEAGGDLCATFTGTFVAVRPGHPAYDRW